MSTGTQERRAPLPLVAIVGRPNVGKSSLFNRLTGRRRAIVTNEPGITRDRLYGVAEWLGKSFEVVDTGGLMPDERAGLAPEILRQARVAIEAAAAVVLVVDARAGVTPLDADLGRLLVRTGKPLVVAANKVDKPRLTDLTLPFHELGISPVISISAEHGLGVDDLLEELTKRFPAAEPPTPAVTVNVALIGRPNVGKSTLLNRLVGSERAIVAPEPGTTRDAVDTLIPADLAVGGAGGWWRLVDTAGIRRKAKTGLLAERLSVVMAHRHLARADVAVLLLDATQGVTKQDAAIAAEALASGRSLILALNKWDAVEKDTDSMTEWSQAIRRQLRFLDYAPLVFISALTGQRVGKLRVLIAEVTAARQKQLGAGEVGEFLRALPLERATVPGGRPVRVLSLRQIATAPPTFEVRANLEKWHANFESFFENQLRERFGFAGTPLRFRLLSTRRRPRRARGKRRA